MEFRNSTNLARFVPVGMVSMVHDEEQSAGSRAIEERGVKLYLWRNPQIGRPPAPGTSPAWLRRWHGRLAAAVLRLHAGGWRPADTVIADLGFRNMSASVLAALKDRYWNVFAVVQSSTAAAIDYVPQADVSVLVMHDIRSLVFARRASTARSWWERSRLRRQARLYFEYERRYAHRYDLLVAVSENDARWMEEHYRPNRVAVVPIAADLDYFSPAGPEEEREGRILFTGLMAHPPNVDAAVFFAEQVFPRIRRETPGAEFFVVGRDPLPEVLALARLPGVTVTGGVPDTRPYFAEASVFVVPLRYGSGVRHKILEAWGMEKCIVSTSVGAEGLQYQDGVNLAIADGPEALSRAVLYALRTPAYRRSLGKEGRRHVRVSHNPQEIAAGYYGRLREIAAEKIERDPMRIAFDMRWLTPGLAGGLENLARSFVRHLLELDAFNSYTLILPARCRRDFDLRSRPNFRVMCRDSAGAIGRDLLWRASASLHSLLRLDYWRSPEVRALEFLRSLHAEMVYSFPGYIHPEVTGVRQVLMVPDIQHEYLPEFFSEQALRERQRLYRDSICQADHICAISEFTRRTLIERLGTPPGKITAVPLAADPIFTPSKDRAADRDRLRKYRLPEEPFLFFPAHTWRHKNHKAVIQAMAILRHRRGSSPPLICTGGAREAQPEIEKLIKDTGLGSLVRFLGYCPHEDLPALYRTAACLVFPSLFEGFGMPVLEAMACGRPVICSNSTSLPEIAGEAAVLVDPADADALAAAIQTVLDDRDLQGQMAARGLEQAARFSWRRHTLQTVEVFYRLHNSLRSVSQQ